MIRNIDQPKTYFEQLPEVKLYKTFTNPFNNSLSTARTCYSSKGIIQDEEITEKHLHIAKQTYEAGHHTVYSHATFEFQLSNISRQFIWSFLHQYPYANSEQVSQRYVEVKESGVIIPKSEYFVIPEAYNIYKECIAYQFQAYKSLTEMLIPTVRTNYQKVFKHRNVEDDAIKGSIKKKALEVARYVLPIGTYAYLYHTISAISLFRYYRLCTQLDVPLETQCIIRAMVDEVLAYDSNYLNIIEDPMPIEQTPEFEFIEKHNDLYTHNPKARKDFIKEFDDDLLHVSSKLISYNQNANEVLGSSVRQILGITKEYLSDLEAVDLLLNPAKNKTLTQTLNVNALSKFGKALNNINFTFKKKLSHTADSQEQRHRTTPGARPIITRAYFNFPDFIIPGLFNYNLEALDSYTGSMVQVWKKIKKLDEMGVKSEFIQYLLPNAVSIRYTESGDLAALMHKYKMRLCFLAQEEVYEASHDEVLQILEVLPDIGKYLLPPCTTRKLANIYPRCDQGKSFCGVPLWNVAIKDYQRIL